MFHSHCGENVELSNRRKTAEFLGDAGYGVVLSKEPLYRGEAFNIKVEETAGGECELTLGVTQTDPNTRPRLPEDAVHMQRSWVLYCDSQWKDGEMIRPEYIRLRVSPGDIVSLIWEDDYISIKSRGYENCVFTGVEDPLWAVTEVNGGIPKLSTIPPGSEKAAPVTRPEPPKSTIGWDLKGDMNEMELGGLGTQSMGASGGPTPKRASGTTCQYWQVCKRFIDSLKLPDIYMDSQYHTCFCINCILSRGDNLYYSRGEPPKTYGLPLGWGRIGLCVPMKAHGLEAFTKWHVAYHGTTPDNIRKIIESDLLMPGDYTLEGAQLAPPSGHFTEDRKPEGFDIKQIFVSPTIAYAGHPAYARPCSWTDPKTGKSHDIQVAFQVRIKPDAYKVGKETLGLGSTIIDAKFKNDELEWSTKIRGATIIQGILVKTLIS